MINYEALFQFLDEQDGGALVSDDNGHWALLTSGMQRVVAGDDRLGKNEPEYTSFMADPDTRWYPTPLACLLGEWQREQEGELT